MTKRRARWFRWVICTSLASLTLGSLAVGKAPVGCEPAMVAGDAGQNEARLTAVAGEGLEGVIALGLSRSLRDGSGTFRVLWSRRVSLEAELKHFRLRERGYSFVSDPGAGAFSVSARVSLSRAGPTISPLRDWVLVGVPFSALAAVLGGRIGPAGALLAEPVDRGIHLRAGSARTPR